MAKKKETGFLNLKSGDTIYYTKGKDVNKTTMAASKRISGVWKAKMSNGRWVHMTEDQAAESTFTDEKGMVWSTQAPKFD